ncbi:3 like protein [Verticillium longisporum]|uniref:3 like protein n=1 Tax=Verticillium longisporum TaxID=100787 RepID=A0A8I2Z6S9_VERLO|nr:3 like protein [Verticillium longisporum]
MSNIISLEYRGRVALLTIDNDAKLNAMNQENYYDLAQKLREIATHDEVFITVLVGKGRYFSAGADVSLANKAPAADDALANHKHWLSAFVANNLNTTEAFFSHPKILVVGLNGPVIGLTAALVAFADFIYITPHTFLLTPFSSLGLVAEGGASRALVQRLGPARSHEALLMSRRITADQLLQTGFANKSFDVAQGDSDRFRDLVLAEVDDKLGEHLTGESLTGIKKLIRAPEREILERQNHKEVFAGLERFVKGRAAAGVCQDCLGAEEAQAVN